MVGFFSEVCPDSVVPPVCCEAGAWVLEGAHEARSNVATTSTMTKRLIRFISPPVEQVNTKWLIDLNDLPVKLPVHQQKKMVTS